MTSDSENSDAGAEAVACWKAGLFCAESVAVALARRQGIETPLLPAMASGFCGGMGHTAGPCGAVTGAVMGLGLAFGRTGPQDSTERVYQAVASLVRQFTEEFGATGCVDLLGCDLGTPEGRRMFREAGLHRRCAIFTERAAKLAADLIEGAARNAEAPQGE
jgi:C_GCAxxG_C_C family probable redox protein